MSGGEEALLVTSGDEKPITVGDIRAEVCQLRSCVWLDVILMDPKCTVFEDDEASFPSASAAAAAAVVVKGKDGRGKDGKDATTKEHESSREEDAKKTQESGRAKGEENVKEEDGSKEEIQTHAGRVVVVINEESVKYDAVTWEKCVLAHARRGHDQALAQCERRIKEANRRITNEIPSHTAQELDMDRIFSNVWFELIDDLDTRGITALLASGTWDVNYQHQNRPNALHLCTRRGEVGLLKLLLQQPTLDIHRTYWDSRAQMCHSAATIAVFHEEMQCLNLLLEHGFDVNVKHMIRLFVNSRTLLHLAVEWEQEDMVDRLLGAGASVNVTDDLGCTPCHLVGSQRRIGKLLLHAGADIEMRNAEEERPLDLSPWLSEVEKNMRKEEETEKEGEEEKGTSEPEGAEKRGKEQEDGIPPSNNGENERPREEDEQKDKEDRGKTEGEDDARFLRGRKRRRVAPDDSHAAHAHRDDLIDGELIEYGGSKSRSRGVGDEEEQKRKKKRRKKKDEPRDPRETSEEESV